MSLLTDAAVQEDGETIRALRARITQLEAMLDSIGAGGIDPLMARDHVAQHLIHAAITALRQALDAKQQANPVGTLSVKVTGPRTNIDFEWSDRLRELPAGNHKLYLCPQPAQQPAIPNGWKLVPIVPNRWMLKEAQAASKCYGDFDARPDNEWSEWLGLIWEGMVDAAPEAPAQQLTTGGAA